MGSYGMGSYNNADSYNMGAPAMMSPGGQPQSVLGNGFDNTQPVQPMMQHAPMVQNSPTQGAPLIMKPVVGAIGNDEWRYSKQLVFSS